MDCSGLRYYQYQQQVALMGPPEGQQCTHFAEQLVAQQLAAQLAEQQQLLAQWDATGRLQCAAQQLAAHQAMQQASAQHVAMQQEMAQQALWHQYWARGQQYSLDVQEQKGTANFCPKPEAVGLANSFKEKAPRTKHAPKPDAESDVKDPEAQRNRKAAQKIALDEKEKSLVEQFSVPRERVFRGFKRDVPRLQSTTASTLFSRRHVLAQPAEPAKPAEPIQVAVPATDGPRQEDGLDVEIAVNDWKMSTDGCSTVEDGETTESACNIINV
jgi:hypothetical protein